MELSLLKEQYEQQLHIYRAFCEYFERECKCLLDGTDIAYYELSFRIKTWDSIVQKIERNNLSPESIQAIYDVIGFRIITLFKRDVDIICETICREFNVLYFDDKAAEKEVDVFGYLSVHYEVALKEHWMGAPTTIQFRGLHTEIQVRTFSQHVWAASSHLLQYKIEQTIPMVMRRSIYRLAAVLEIVDNELESIRDFRDNYQNQLKEIPAFNQNKEFSDQVLDSILLESILDMHFPHENKKPCEPYDVVLSEAFAYGVRTVEQLEKLLTEQKSYIAEKEQARIAEYHHPFYSFTGLLRIALSQVRPKPSRH